MATANEMARNRLEASWDKMVKIQAREIPANDLKSEHEAFLAEQSCRRKPCATSPYARICNGGCRRQNVCYLTDDACAYRDVLAQIVPALARMYGLG